MVDDSKHHPLLSNGGADDHHHHHDNNNQTPILRNQNDSFAADDDEEDIPPIKSLKDFSREFWVELYKTTYLAAPAIFMGICQYSLGAITQTFAGQLSTLDLAAVSVENSVIAGFSFGALGMLMSVSAIHMIRDLSMHVTLSRTSFFLIMLEFTFGRTGQCERLTLACAR